jgi:hypothetical protein
MYSFGSSLGFKENLLPSSSLVHMLSKQIRQKKLISTLKKISSINSSFSIFRRTKKLKKERHLKSF